MSSSRYGRAVTLTATADVRSPDKPSLAVLKSMEPQAGESNRRIRRFPADRAAEMDRAVQLAGTAA
jgi:hypothetical protein